MEYKVKFPSLSRPFCSTLNILFLRSCIKSSIYFPYQTLYKNLYTYLSLCTWTFLTRKKSFWIFMKMDYSTLYKLQSYIFSTFNASYPAICNNKKYFSSFQEKYFKPKYLPQLVTFPNWFVNTSLKTPFLNKHFNWNHNTIQP